MPAILSLAFRPFFLAAALWAAGAMALWMMILFGGLALPSRFGPLGWHIHEMLFGFVEAAAAGFLLTAIPNWTGRPAVRGGPLSVLLGLWLIGRVTGLVSAYLPAWAAGLAELAFPIGLAATAAREMIAARNWRNLPMVAPLVVFALADLLMLLAAEGVDLPVGLGWRLALTATLILLSAVGARIIPAFTRNWLTRRDGQRLPVTHRTTDRLALGLLHAALLLWVVQPEATTSGVAALAAAGLNLWRLAGWRGQATIEEPLLFVLHVGYAWLVLGVALLGLSILELGPSLSSGVHALTAGAISTMIVGVMARVTRGHTGNALVSDRPTVAIFALVSLAAIARVGAALGETWAEELIIMSMSLWISAFAGFVLMYGKMLLGPRKPQ